MGALYRAVSAYALPRRRRHSDCFQPPSLASLRRLLGPNCNRRLAAHLVTQPPCSVHPNRMCCLLLRRIPLVEIQSARVDAVALAAGLARAIVEHMSEVRSALLHTTSVRRMNTSCRPRATYASPLPRESRPPVPDRPCRRRKSVSLQTTTIPPLLLLAQYAPLTRARSFLLCNVDSRGARRLQLRFVFLDCTVIPYSQCQCESLCTAPLPLRRGSAAAVARPPSRTTSAP